MCQAPVGTSPPPTATVTLLWPVLLALALALTGFSQLCSLSSVAQQVFSRGGLKEKPCSPLHRAPHLLPPLPYLTALGCRVSAS